MDKEPCAIPALIQRKAQSTAAASPARQGSHRFVQETFRMTQHTPTEFIDTDAKFQQRVSIQVWLAWLWDGYKWSCHFSE